MIQLNTLEDLNLIQESVSLECKLAIGRDGTGALPEDFWPTYSAFANTDGGVVLLGVSENKGKFNLVGIETPDKVRKELFNNLNNRQKISRNLLTDQHVLDVVIEGKHLIIVSVPRARREERPIYLSQNPLAGHTYRRLNEGDYALPDEEVKRMLAEQVEDSRDDRVLIQFSLDDLNLDTLRSYRQVFTNRDPLHPWNAVGDLEFLRMVGGWKKERESGASGLSVAGLLMFGQMHAIQEAFPNYMLDYQERLDAKNDKRWIDRLTLDGKWSGNLYDFYRKIYLKLTADLKVPFTLQQGERQDETPVHVALREALANVLVHADYSDRASVLVIKRSDMFGFRNPGLMRIPVEIAMQGGEADCRNRILHKMFRFVGVGEQAGTGVPKIVQGWGTQHWNPPKLYETCTPYNQTLLELRMIDLFPQRILDNLIKRFGNKLEILNVQKRTALALVAAEGSINHARLSAVLNNKHSVEVSRTLQLLVSHDLLESTGGRGAVYHLPGQVSPTPENVFDMTFFSSSSGLKASSSGLKPSSSGLNSSSLGLKSTRDSQGCFVSDQLPLPIINDINELSDALKFKFEGLADAARTKKKIPHQAMEEIILKICDGYFITLNCLAEMVNRKPIALRNEYLTSMVKNRALSLAFPTRPTHERQAYCATSSLPSNTK